MRHNDYPPTLLMEPAANDEPSRYRMTPAASTVRRQNSEPTSAELTAAEDYWHACHMFEHMACDMPPAVVSFHPGDPPMGTLAELAATESASGDALIGFKTEPEDEVWHTEAPTVAGVYIADNIATFDDSERWCAHWDGKDWRRLALVSLGTQWARGKAVSHVGKQWLRLIEADTPALPTQYNQ